MNETFVIRVWTSSDPPQVREGRLHGFVEHVGAPGRHAFSSGEELLAAIRADLERRESEAEEETR